MGAHPSVEYKDVAALPIKCDGKAFISFNIPKLTYEDNCRTLIIQCKVKSGSVAGIYVAPDEKHPDANREIVKQTLYNFCPNPYCDHVAPRPLTVLGTLCPYCVQNTNKNMDRVRFSSISMHQYYSFEAPQKFYPNMKDLAQQTTDPLLIMSQLNENLAVLIESHLRRRDFILYNRRSQPAGECPKTFEEKSLGIANVELADEQDPRKVVTDSAVRNKLLEGSTFAVRLFIRPTFEESPAVGVDQATRAAQDQLQQVYDFYPIYHSSKLVSKGGKYWLTIQQPDGAPTPADVEVRMFWVHDPEVVAPKSHDAADWVEGTFGITAKQPANLIEVDKALSAIGKVCDKRALGGFPLPEDCPYPMAPPTDAHGRERPLPSFVNAGNTSETKTTGADEEKKSTDDAKVLQPAQANAAAPSTPNEPAAQNNHTPVNVNLAAAKGDPDEF